MRALAANVTERFRRVAVDLDPEHVDVRDGAEDLQVAFGLGVEVEIEQQSEIGAESVTQRFEMHVQIAQYGGVDVELRIIRRAEAGAPAARVLAVLINEDV